MIWNLLVASAFLKWQPYFQIRPKFSMSHGKWISPFLQSIHLFHLHRFTRWFICICWRGRKRAHALLCLYNQQAVSHYAHRSISRPPLCRGQTCELSFMRHRNVQSQRATQSNTHVRTMHVSIERFTKGESSVAGEACEQINVVYIKLFEWVHRSGRRRSDATVATEHFSEIQSV